MTAHTGKGSRNIENFVVFLNKETAKAIAKYESHSEKIYGKNDVELPHHIFEQVTKGFITIAINKITKTNFLQELPIKRKDGGNERNGKIDYFARYKNINLLIEVKQIRTSTKKGEIVLNPSINLCLEECINQIQSIKNPTSIDDAEGIWYGIAMCIVPLYVSKKMNPNGFELSDDKIDKIKKKIKASHISYHKEKKREYINVNDAKGEYIFPGYLIALKTKKLSREQKVG